MVLWEENMKMIQTRWLMRWLTWFDFLVLKTNSPVMLCAFNVLTWLFPPLSFHPIFWLYEQRLPLVFRVGDIKKDLFLNAERKGEREREKTGLVYARCELERVSIEVNELVCIQNLRRAPCTRIMIMWIIRCRRRWVHEHGKWSCDCEWESFWFLNLVQRCL